MIRLISSIILCLIVISCADKSPHTALQTEMDALLANEFSPEEPGGSFLVKKGSEVVYLQSYGLADLNTKEKITENTIFNTGSISKTFVSNGILILQERGLLSVEDSLSKYFDDFDHQELADQVKIKHMLSHTSGLPDMRKVGENPDFYLTAKDKENFEPLKHADSLLFQPGERYDYSNPAFNGLALIIEQLANQPWQDFIKENIFTPAGMKNSRITNGPHPESGVAHAYTKDENGKYQEDDYGEFPTFAAAGNGGIWCSILDLAKYESAIQKNVFLGKELIDESRTIFTPQNWSDTLKPNIGYSWFLSDKNYNVNLIFHTGSQGGFRAYYISIPEKDILVVGLFNRPSENFWPFLRGTLKLLEKKNWLDKA